MRKCVGGWRSQLRAPRGEEGSAMVEMALSLTLLLTVIFGVIEFGFAIYSYNVVSEAAREATRYAIVRGRSCTTFASACPAQASDITAFVQGLGFPGITGSNMNATTSFSATTAGPACPGTGLCNLPGNQVQVTVTYPFPLTIPFIPAKTLSMSSTSQMVISQ